jgi:hypothetical protein
MKHLVVALDSLGLNDIEDEQMATMDMPDDRSDGFIGVSDEDVLGLSDTSATTAGSSNSNSNSTDGRTARFTRSSQRCPPLTNPQPVRLQKNCRISMRRCLSLGVMNRQ